MTLQFNTVGEVHYVQGRARQQMSLVNNGQRLYTYSIGNRPAHESTQPCQVVDECQTTSSGYGIRIHIVQTWTYCIHIESYHCSCISLLVLPSLALYPIETVLVFFSHSLMQVSAESPHCLRVRTLWFVCTTRLFILYAAGFARPDETG